MGLTSGLPTFLGKRYLQTASCPNLSGNSCLQATRALNSCVTLSTIDCLQITSYHTFSSNWLLFPGKFLIELQLSGVWNGFVSKLMQGRMIDTVFFLFLLIVHSCSFFCIPNTYVTLFSFFLRRTSHVFRNLFQVYEHTFTPESFRGRVVALP